MGSGCDGAGIKVALKAKTGAQDTAKFKLKLCEFSSHRNRRNQY